MNRRNFLALALGIAALAGCGGGGGSTSTNPAGRGAVEGFVFSAADGSLRVFNTAAEGVAAGLQPAAGARAQVVGGAGSATIGRDGRLQVQGIEVGARTLRLTASSGATKDIPLTVVPNAVLPLGETPVNRQQAADALQAFATRVGVPELFTNADVLVSSTPLPAGVAIRPALPTGEEPLSVESPSWLVYVDREPSARFGHPTLIALVDATTGAVKGIDSSSWPRLNGFHLYEERTVNATSPDAVQTATRRLAFRTAQATPALESQLGNVASRLAATCRSKDPDTSRTRVLMVQGDWRNDFATDMDTVDQILRAAPFPEIALLRKVKTFEYSDPLGGFQLEFAAMRDSCKSGDTFVLYITSHGILDYSEEPTTVASPREDVEVVVMAQEVTTPRPPRPPVPVERTAPRYRLSLAHGIGIKPGALDFSSCKACRIILWIDTCYSGNWIPLLQPQLSALPDKDILILTSADHKTPAQGLVYESEQEEATVNGETINLPLGGVFSQSLLLGVQRLQASNPPETGADLLDMAFPYAETVTPVINTLGRLRLQNPTRYRRALAPDAVCGRGDQEVTIK